MSEKRFRVRFEQEDGRGEIVNEKGVELTAREVVDCLNEQQTTIDQLNLTIDDLLSHTSCDEIKKENEQLRQKLDFYLLDEFEWKEKYGD